eukprot:g81940.t1
MVCRTLDAHHEICGKIMTNAQYNKYTRDCKQVYGVSIGEDENLVFTAEYRSKVLDAAACGHDALHAALVNGGGGFVQHRENPNYALVFLGANLWGTHEKHNSPQPAAEPQQQPLQAFPNNEAHAIAITQQQAKALMPCAKVREARHFVMDRHPQWFPYLEET